MFLKFKGQPNSLFKHFFKSLKSINSQSFVLSISSIVLVKDFYYLFYHLNV